MVRLAINGFGRIGRVAFRAALENYRDQIEVVAINTSGSMPANGWAHLFKYDSVYGRFPEEVTVASMAERKDGEPIGTMTIQGKEYPLLAEKVPAKVPWSRYGVDVVIESTGVFRNTAACMGHIEAGAQKVIITAPARDNETPTYVLGANASEYRGEKVISNASCTTNCIAPIARLMTDNFQVQKAAMTTVHAYTSDQELVDSSHNDLRRARSATSNIVPTTTGAAIALGKVLPGILGNFSGIAIRVPVPCGSMADFTFCLGDETDAARVNKVFIEGAQGPFKGILNVTNEPLVSSDILGESASALIDLSLTAVVGKNMVKVIAWYDNEWGYACRLLEMAVLVAGR
jgi:glyceraldehyde 3-phosphate dehydrogenase